MRNARLKPEIIDRAKNCISRVFEMNQQIKNYEVILDHWRSVRDNIEETSQYSHHKEHARRIGLSNDDLKIVLISGIDNQIDLVSDKLDHLHLSVDAMFNETK